MRAERAAVLGVAQGLAEVVPVSSSAQLVLVPWLLRWDPAADRTTFGAALHAGSCAGIAFALRRELQALDARTVALVAASSVPAAVTGLLAQDAVERRLGRPPQLAALLGGFGALMWWVDNRRAAADHLTSRSLRDAPGVPRSDPRVTRVGARQAALAGLAQAVAVVPGVSRSGATLTALRATGVPLPAAERFSLLMSLPVTAGAAVLTLARARAVPRGAPTGAAVAAVTGAVAARHLRPRQSLRAPALYRLGLAALVARRLIREGAA